MYGKFINNSIIYAPKYFELSDGTVIENFNENIELLRKYGYKEVIEIRPSDYNSATDILFIIAYDEDIHMIKIVYDKRTIEVPKDDYTLVIEEQKRLNDEQVVLKEDQGFLIENQTFVEEVLLDTDFRLLQLEIALEYPTR